jgi:hypothetical protein
VYVVAYGGEGEELADLGANVFEPRMIERRLWLSLANVKVRDHRFDQWLSEL